MRRVKERPSGRYSILLVAGYMAVYYAWLTLLPFNGNVIRWGAELMQNGAPLIAAGVVYRACRRTTGGDRIFCRMVLAGCLLFSAGQLALDYEYLILKIERPLTGVPDILFLASSVCVLASIAYHFKRFIREFSVPFLLDSLIVMTVAAATYWFLLEQWHGGEIRDPGVWMNCLYTAINLGELFGTLVVFVGTGNRIVRMNGRLLVILSLMAFAAGNSGAIYTAMSGRGVSGTLFDPLFSLGFLLLAVSGLFESRDIRAPEKSDPAIERFLGGVRTYTPIISVLWLFILHLAYDGNRLLELALPAIVVQVLIRQMMLLSEKKSMLHELRHKQKQYDTVIQHIPEVILMTDPELRVTFVSPAWASWTGYGPDKVKGKLLTELIAIPDTWCGLAFQTVRVPVNKGERWAELRLYEQVSETGERSGYFGLMIDITKQYRWEEEQCRARAEAVSASRAKSRFLSRISHEVRSPLNSIVGFAQLLLMSELAEPFKKDIRHILSAGQYAAKLLDDLLDLSRIEQGVIQVNQVPVRISEVAAQCEDLISSKLKERCLTFSQELRDGDLWVEADEIRLRQVLINLLNNAVAYNMKGGRVELKVEKTGHQHCRISIADTGRGIPEGELKNIFEPFYRWGESSNFAGGAGIGLSIARQLAELMRGTLGVESKLGQGSVFWLELPLASADPGNDKDYEADGYGWIVRTGHHS